MLKVERWHLLPSPQVAFLAAGQQAQKAFHSNAGKFFKPARQM
jgi:hypothetical protein